LSHSFGLHVCMCFTLLYLPSHICWVSQPGFRKYFKPVNWLICCVHLSWWQCSPRFFVYILTNDELLNDQYFKQVSWPKMDTKGRLIWLFGIQSDQLKFLFVNTKCSANPITLGTIVVLGLISPNFFVPSEKSPVHRVRQKNCGSILPTFCLKLC